MWSNFFKYGSDLKFLKLYFAEELSPDLDNRKNICIFFSCPLGFKYSKESW